MLVREGMSEVVLTVGPTHTLREAATMMTEKGTGAALVDDDERPVPASSPSVTSCSRSDTARTPMPSASPIT